MKIRKKKKREKKESLFQAVSGATEMLKKTLAQALIIVPEEIEEPILDCTEIKFKTNFCKNDGTKEEVKYVIDFDKYWDMYSYMENKLTDIYKERYNDHYRVYFFNEQCADSKKSGINGYAFMDSQYAVYFKTHNAATVGHEMFHCLGLQHSFDYTEISKSDYAYQYAKTDNMLDYSHMEGISIQSLFYWQWEKINAKIKL